MVSKNEGDTVDLARMEVKPAKLNPVPRGKVAQPNPMADHLEASWDEPLSMVLSSKEALAAQRMLRKAAMREGHGVTVQFQDVSDADVVIPESRVRESVTPTTPNGPNVRIVFQAREFKPKAARREDDDTDE